MRAWLRATIACALPLAAAAFAASCGHHADEHPPAEQTGEQDTGPSPYHPTDASAGDATDGGDTHDARDAADALDGADANDGGSDGADASDSGDASDGGDGPLDVAETAVDATDAAMDTGPFIVTDECGPPLSTSTSTACGATVQFWADEGHDHVPIGTTVLYCTRPPSSGPHYGIWAAFRSYDRPVHSSYLVHDLEHGAVVVRYQCATSCPAIASALQAVIDARPVDPMCEALEAGVKRRVILVPDPSLDVAVAASAWAWTYRATCVDATSLGAFIDAHYAMATENFCNDGDPDAGGP